MADVEEVTTFAPAGCTCEMQSSSGATRQSGALHVITIGAPEIQRAIQAAVASLVADWDRIAQAQREARAGGGRLLDEVLADAARTSDDRGARGPAGPRT